jgi:hypothetical protein
MTLSASFSIVGMGATGSRFNGIMPGNKHDMIKSPLMIIINFGIYPLVFINDLLWRTPLK